MKPKNRGQHEVKMSGKYPVTAKLCPICEELKRNVGASVVDRDFQSSVSKARACPVHNWYTFVHTYSPQFVEYEIRKKGITSDQQVLDPFVGTGTTLVECKFKGINSVGVDILDFLTFASKIKTEWEVGIEELKTLFSEIKSNAEKNFLNNTISKKPLFLKESYISPKPLAKLLAIKDAISELKKGKFKDVFVLAFAGIIVPSSNVRFGPNFGLIKPREDVDVFGLFEQKVARIVSDLKYAQKIRSPSISRAVKGDSRKLTSFIKERFDLVVTSPPYPQDHDYTRQTRLELILLEYLKDANDLRAIKKEMLRASTRNVYSTDNDYQYISKFKDVTSLMNKIDYRVKETGGTSGFEKIYAKLVGEYFGGMYRCLQEIFSLLEKGGTAALLVGDSHAFKMVHIQTARILSQFALDIGYKKYELELWQNIRSTAHKYQIPEHILELYK